MTLKLTTLINPVFEPSTVHQCRLIVELALREGQTVHPVGVGHSPSDLACTRGFMVKMEGLKGLVSVSLDCSHRKLI
jgi:L-gulonolactone oxidase